MLLKFEIIWRRIDNLTIWDLEILLNFLKHIEHLKWYQIFLNTLYHGFLTANDSIKISIKF